MARDAFISNSFLAATLILLSTKLDEAAFYSQVTELFVPRGTYTAPPGLLSPVSITGESTDASFIRPCEDFFRVGEFIFV